VLCLADSAVLCLRSQAREEDAAHAANDRAHLTKGRDAPPSPVPQASFEPAVTELASRLRCVSGALLLHGLEGHGQNEVPCG